MREKRDTYNVSRITYNVKMGLLLWRQPFFL